jgi:hypothetical protein
MIEHCIDNQVMDISANVYAFFAYQIIHKHGGSKGVITQQMVDELQQIGLVASVDKKDWMDDLFNYAVDCKKCQLGKNCIIAYVFDPAVSDYFDKKANQQP